MQNHYLEKLFNPRSIALIGASDKQSSLGKDLFTNIVAAGFTGVIYPVNPKYKEIKNLKCYKTVKDIKQEIDLAVIVTKANVVEKVLRECGEQFIQQVIILSEGFSESGAKGSNFEKKIVNVAREFNIRLVGPNCLGLMRPANALNATLDNSPVLPGNIALVSQSGAICAAILDWAYGEKIGFSTVVSVGNGALLGFGEVLDYLALDKKTDCILLYIEHIKYARGFMSGLRAASRLKPVIVIKSGRHGEGERLGISHTGAMIGSDDVFDAALKRAGAVRVMTIKELFTAAEVFASKKRLKGDQLIIVTNGGGAGLMAADHAADLYISLSKLNDGTINLINAALPRQLLNFNPIDILGDATYERYQKVMTAIINDSNCDCLLVILAPTALAEPLLVAKEIVALNKKTDKPILTCWMGREQVKTSGALFSEANIPCFSTPEIAVEAFSYLCDYYRNQQLLLQVPETISYKSKADINGAKLIIEKALSENRSILNTIDSKEILKAFGIPVTKTIAAQSEKEALNIADTIGFPLVMKINSPDITHKQDVSGVQLNITNMDGVSHFFTKLISNAKKAMPNARIDGVTIERMYKTPNDRELMIGVLQDEVFGPVINFGAGGNLVEVMQDRALALPPLNQYLAKNVIASTNIAKLLGKFRNKPAVNVPAIEELLLRVSELVSELGQIQEMDINPLIVNDKGLIAVDARIVINSADVSIPYSHMAIHPYPSYLVSEWQLDDYTSLTIRPIRPEDAKFEQDFVRSLSEESKYFRFMGAMQEMTPDMLKRTTQIDYDREMALVAVIQKDAVDIIIAIARYVTNPDFKSCEFALVVADEWQNKGIGSHLMRCLINAAKIKDLESMEGAILASNNGMLALVGNLGFNITSDPIDPTLELATKIL